MKEISLYQRSLIYTGMGFLFFMAYIGFDFVNLKITGNSINSEILNSGFPQGFGIFSVILFYFLIILFFEIRRLFRLKENDIDIKELIDESKASFESQ